jgi:hypothetical protein
MILSAVAVKNKTAAALAGWACGVGMQLAFDAGLTLGHDPRRPANIY